MLLNYREFAAALMRHERMPQGKTILQLMHKCKGEISMKQLMSGNEAIARGIYEAGIRVCSAYPGTPSTEVLEQVVQYKDKVYCEWAPNEKVATEVAYGACVAGSRSFTTMKMVGMNVAADPMFTAAYLGVNAGYVIMTADDPSMHSSQNEQDNRNYARHAKIPCIEPSDSQECKDFVKVAIEISEKFNTPVMFRTTTRINHSKSLVEFGEREEVELKPYSRNPKYMCTPANAYKARVIVEERTKALAEYAEDCPINTVEMGDGEYGVISSAVSYEYAKEIFPEGTSFLKLGMSWPLPMKKIRDFAGKVKKLYVIEELDPFIEDQVRAAGIDCIGKSVTGPMYEYNTQLLRDRIFGTKTEPKNLPVEAVPRPPALCPGCPHRGFYYTVSKYKDAVVCGDIGCYTLGGAAPLSAVDTCLCMGGGFSVAMGMAKAFEQAGIKKTVFGCVGDSTFFHSGMTGAAEIIYNKGHVIPCVLDNHITGMTGHQDNPGTGYTLQGEMAAAIKIEDVLYALGYKKVLIADPQDLDAMKAACDEALASTEPVAIISRRPCILIKRNKKPTGKCKVNPDVCRSCRKCLSCGCPAISIQNGKAFIDAAQCVGCTVCAQICPFHAIEKEEQ